MGLFAIHHYLRTALWVVPVLCVLAGVALSLATVAVDDGDLFSVTFTGGPDAALVILGTIAASMVTLTGLVLTIVLVVVQLAMGQFSPRIVRAILRDRPSQLAIGVFVATFAHALLAMREIASVEEGAPVPGLAILVAFVLVLISIMVLVGYVHHIGQSLRVASLVAGIGDETRQLVDKLYPDPRPTPEDDDPAVVVAPHSGVLFRIDQDRLVEVARAAGCCLRLHHAVGDFVPAGSPLCSLKGGQDGARPAATARFRKQVIGSLALGPERTMNQDAAYGFRMLVDIAQRSLSDSNDDPTTAVAAIDRLHDLLRRMATRPFPSGEHRDDAGRLRVVIPTISWEGYVHLAFDEIREASSVSLQVSRRLRSALEDLLAVAPSERRPVLDEQLRLLRGAIDDQQHDDEQTWGVGDVQGLGSGLDMEIVPAGTRTRDGADL